MAKRFDPKAKARKQKILAAVLGVVFLAVFAYQAPTILGLFKGSSSTASSEPTPTPAPAPAPAATAPAASTVPAAAPAGSAGLIDSDVAPEPADGQLVTFDRFESKDPFVQQVGGGAPAPTGAGAQDQAPPQQEKEGVAPPSPQPPARIELQQAPAAPGAARTATISVNGASEDVGVSGTFPKGEPIFKLTKLTRTTAKIGIVGGTYASGSQTVTLRKGGKPVTLMNTADGTTYVLRLLDVG